jgi:integrase
MPKLKRFKKAANNQGTIFDREITRKDGSTYVRWEAHISLGKDGRGYRKRKIVYASTQAEVLAKLEKIKTQVTVGTYSEDKRTLTQYLSEWLTHKKLEVKPSSLQHYELFVDHHITTSLGGIKFTKLTPQHVRQMMQEVSQKTSNYAANKSRAILSRALRQAVQDGVIPRNVCEMTQPFRVEPRPDVTWSNDEVLLFLSVARAHRLYAAFYLALSTGMRRGEILGLRWQDVQSDKLIIAQSLIKVGNGYAISTPKTERSKRFVTLDAETIAVLEEHRLKQTSEARDLKEEWKVSKHLGLVFTSEAGKPLDLNNFQRKWYLLQEAAREAYIKLGQTDEAREVRKKQLEEGRVLPHLRFHDLRHMHVSLLNRAGVDARTIADRIGHVDPAFTIKRYAHVFDCQRKAAAIPLLRLLAPSKGETT